MRAQYPTRRQFVKTTASVSAAASCVGPAALTALGGATPLTNRELTLIDTHQHLWDLSKFRLPWTDGNEKLTRNYLIPEYSQAIRGTGIKQAIYMEVGMTYEQQVAEAEWVVDLCENGKTLTIAGVIAGQPLDDGFVGYIDRFAKHPCIKGVRHLLQVPESPQGMCRAPEYRAGIQALAKRNLRFDVCIRPTELADATELIKSCPDTQFVLDHCGNADPAAFGNPEKYQREPQHTASQWKRDIEAMAKQENVICKISGIIARVAPDDWSSEDLAPIVNHCLDSFGPERVMFASDWPVCTLGAPLAEWVKALKEIVADRPEAQQRQLFAENAERFYGLS